MDWQQGENTLGMYLYLLWLPILFLGSKQDYGDYIRKHINKTLRHSTHYYTTTLLLDIYITTILQHYNIRVCRLRVCAYACVCACVCVSSQSVL